MSETQLSSQQAPLPSHGSFQQAPLPLDVAVIGGGFAGIGTAIRLKQKRIENLAIFERGSAPGGTWRDNTYPGAACDIPSRLYSYSFAPNPDWSHTYSGSAEILKYIERMVDDFGLRPLLRFGHNVTGVHWDEASSLWEVTFDDHPSVRARSVVMASGPLANVSFPGIRGLDTYEGHKIHSARWDHEFDFTGKKVAVIGTGASGVQIVPELVKVAQSVKVFQRTPGWALPRTNLTTRQTTKDLYRKYPACL